MIINRHSEIPFDVVSWYFLFFGHHPNGSLRFTTHYSFGPIGLPPARPHIPPRNGRHGFTSLMRKKNLDIDHIDYQRFIPIDIQK